MPFDSQEKVIYGTDAKTPTTWARIAFCKWLQNKLNDPDGPYAVALGITAQRQAFVSENPEVLQAQYREKNAPPVVSIAQGPVMGSDYYRSIGSVEYKGRRIEVECTLGMGVRDRTPDDDNAATERSDDNNLAGFVTDAINEGFQELNELGIFNASIEPDPEAGVKHPQKLTFFLRTLRDWTPTP